MDLGCTGKGWTVLAHLEFLGHNTLDTPAADCEISYMFYASTLSPWPCTAGDITLKEAQEGHPWAAGICHMKEKES